MATIRNTASQVLTGPVGNTTFYYLNGQQVARQSKNNSNFGEAASRSVAQQSRRVQWANLVNLYKVMAYWMPKAFESKKRNQSDYNAFMSKNVNSSQIFLTKEEAAQGCAVVFPYIISQGSLPPIIPQGPDALNKFSMDVSLGAGFNEDLSIGEISARIIDNNPGWMNGDNLALILFSNWADGTTFPYAASQYYEFTLDVASQEPFSSHPFYNIITEEPDTHFISVQDIIRSTPRLVGWSAIHTRQANTLKVSTQSIVVNKPIIIDAYSSDLVRLAAMESYGVDAEVPLDPSATSSNIDAINVNGQPLSGWVDGSASIEGAAVVEISAPSVGSAAISLWRGQSILRPIATANGVYAYLVDTNGEYRVIINGVAEARFTVSGISMPQGLPALLTSGLYDAIGGQPVPGSMLEDTTSTIRRSLPYLQNNAVMFAIGGEGFTGGDLAESQFTFYGAAESLYDESPEGVVELSVLPTSSTSVVCIFWKGWPVLIMDLVRE